MTRRIVPWVLPALLWAACVVPGETRVGFAVGVEGAPPPPQMVIVAEPAAEPVETGAYVVADPSVPYDMFRFGASWYVYSGGYWYRAPGYRGPFAVVDVRRVPRQVLEVPPGRWKHHPHGGPPGLARKQGGREG